MDPDLPAPGSEELKRQVTREDLRLVYEFLYKRRSNPPTMVEIHDHVAAMTGTARSQTDRRVRELRNWFRVPAVQSGRDYTYHLEGRADTVRTSRGGISARVRGEVLSARRCAQCGKTPLGDHIKLEIDHKIPHSWGGTDDIENLQPLCEQCNHDKQAFYSSMSPFEEQIRAATAHHEPHRRIGELLKAFHRANAEAPSEIVAVVASMHQYQEDWQKRMRELGWEFETIKRKEHGRVRSYYRLTAFTDWPPGTIASQIRRSESARKAAGRRND
ncbi:HNH endonuclease [Salana multivorans]